MKYLKPIILILIVLTLDQIFKIWVFKNMTFGRAGEIHVMGFDWFRLHYTLNNGIAFGFLDGDVHGYNPTIKVVLTSFRLLASVLIGYIIYMVINKKMALGFVLSLSFILAGALGNIIDSIFYDVIFNTNFLNDGHEEVRKLFQGSVVDMLYFPLISGYYPDWIPKLGGSYFEFFRPVFNLADSSITIGVFSILIFHRKSLKQL